jgi:hypothetical protein
MADRLLDMAVPRERLVVKPHFVADPGPRPGPPSASDEVLFIGRLAPGKGIDTLLEAWPAVGLGLRLAVVGDGPLAAGLEDRVPEGVELLGWRSRAEVTERLLRARALVMPTEWYEPFGMVLIEAMSAGLPVIVTTAAGARTIVSGRESLVVPPGRPEALAVAITSLDDDTVDAEGAANRARFEDRYTEAIGVANLEALYASVLSGEETPACVSSSSAIRSRDDSRSPEGRAGGRVVFGSSPEPRTGDANSSTGWAVPRSASPEPGTGRSRPRGRGRHTSPPNSSSSSTARSPGWTSCRRPPRVSPGGPASPCSAPGTTPTS